MATRKPSAGEDPLAHLAEGPRLVYALDGEERVLVDEALHAIKEASLPAKARDFNLDVLNARDTPPIRAIEAALTLPAFAQYRVVVVKDAERWEKIEIDPLVSYLEKPSPSTVLILVAEERFDGRLKLYKALERAGVLIRFPHPHEREMPRLIERRAKSLQVAIDGEGVRALVEAIGANVGGAIEALEKLALYVGPESGRTVSRPEVEAVVSPAKEESIFELSDAVGARDVPRSLELLSSMLSLSRAHPLALLGMLAGHWRRLIVAKSLTAERAPRDTMLSALRVPPFVVERLLGQARRQPMEALLAGLEAIRAADRALKGGHLDGDRVMESLVLALARD
jgi:DNA polymerase III subunit delta